MASQLLTAIKRIGEARRNEKLSRADFEAMKLEKFRRLVRLAADRSPYYADIIKTHNIDVDKCVPQDFPALTKTILMEHFDRIVTDRSITKAKVAEFLTHSKDPNELLFGKYRVLHTSGSSGEVGYFLYSTTDWISGMAGMQGRRAERRFKRNRSGRVRIAYYAAIGGHFAGVSMVGSAAQSLGKLFVNLKMFEVNSPLPAVIEELNKFQPEMLSGYTTALKILAEKQNQGVLRIAPSAVMTAGEAMTPADRAFLEGTFKCPAFNGYGTTEHLMMGAANPDGETMTLFDDNLIYEIFEDHTLVTNLFNTTMPLIRYRMSDILRPVEQQNPNSPYLVIKSLIGRTEKVPTFLNRDGSEDFISPHTINEVFVAGLTRFQMRLVSKTHFQFAVVLDLSLDPGGRESTYAAIRDRLQEILNQKAMQNVTFDVLPVDDLPVDARTGKFRLIVDAV